MPSRANSLDRSVDQYWPGHGPMPSSVTGVCAATMYGRLWSSTSFVAACAWLSGPSRWTVAQVPDRIKNY
jgi:hypothetical protein